MQHNIDLDWEAQAVFDTLPTGARGEALALIAIVQRAPDDPTATLLTAFGPRCWITYQAHPDGIEIHDIGWAG